MRQSLSTLRPISCLSRRHLPLQLYNGFIGTLCLKQKLLRTPPYAPTHIQFLWMFESDKAAILYDECRSRYIQAGFPNKLILRNKHPVIKQLFAVLHRSHPA